MIKKLLMMTAVVAAFVAATGPAWAQRTVTWPNSTVSSISIMFTDNTVFTYLGIQAEALGYMEWDRTMLKLHEADTLRFVSAIGKIQKIVFFSRYIDINDPEEPVASLGASGWSQTDSTFEWTGTPSDTVILTMIELEYLRINDIDSLVFTVELPSYTLGNIPAGWQVTANGDAVSVTNGEALIKEGAVVTLTPTVSAMDSVKNVTIYSLNTLTISGVNFYYLAGETWTEAIANHSAENAGWSTDESVRFNGNKILYNDNIGSMIDANDEIDPSLIYSLIDAD
ncbi:MAG: hypothetical protein IJ620_06325 [Bacteroidales bacterium]|nr:hypothetical protein [Bacteroidales bacterium]